MSFMDLVKGRRSTRRFKEREIEEKDILLCAEAARLAPSACNSQPWTFVVVRTKEKRDSLAAAALSGLYTDSVGPNSLLRTAPVIVALVCEKMKIAARSGAFIRATDYSLMDIGISGEHFVLQAAELGIGTCWVGWFNEKRVREALNVPKSLSIPALIAMGYPEEENPQPKTRKELEDVLCFDEYQR